MKKYLRLTPLFVLLLPLLYFTGCKKCYTCKDTCMMCLYTHPAADTIYKLDSLTWTYVIAKIDTVTVTDSLIHCTDYFGTMAQYDSAIAQDEEMGAPCYPHNPTYSHNFCTTDPGIQQYTNYYDKGGAAPCNPK